MLDRVGRLKCIDGRERESERKSGGALSSEAFERQARSRTFGHLRARERERAHTCVQYRPAPLHHHQPGIYSRQRGEEWEPCQAETLDSVRMKAGHETGRRPSHSQVYKMSHAREIERESALRSTILLQARACIHPQRRQARPSLSAS